MLLEIEKKKDVVFVRINGDIIRGNCYEINTELIPFILNNRITKMVLNLKNVNRVDDDGYESILNIKTALRHNGGVLCLYEDNNNYFKRCRFNVISNENEIYNY